MNTWNHVTVTWDGTSTAANVQFFVNGVKISHSFDTNGSGSPHTDDSSELIHIGNNNSGTRGFDGGIDEVKVYNYIRTQKQIISDMNAGHPAVGSPVASAIGHWKFDEGVGTTANNSGSAVTAINGTLGSGTSAPTWTNSGKFGRALTFDGSNDNVSMGNDSSLNIIGQNLTLSAWVKRSSSTQGGVVVSRGTAGSNGYAFGIGNIQGSGCTTHQIAIGKFGVTWKCIDSFPADTSWHHLVIALNASGESAYIDGKLMGSNTDTGSIATSTNNFRIGIGTDGASLFGGTLDEIKMYNYALNADQVKTEYNQGKTEVFGALSTASDGVTADNSSAREYCVPGDSGSCSYPVHLWTFDEGTGTAGNDIGTSPLSATLANGTTWATGKIGKGLSYDGCSGCSQDDSNSVASLTLPTVMTIEAWIYPKTTGEGGLGRIVDNTSDITWFVNSSNANRMEFSAVWSTANGNWYATPGITYNVWNHVAVVYDYGSTANTPTFYVNGVKQTTNVGSGSPSGTHSLSAHTFYIGNNSTGVRTWDGLIDQVKMYDYARTAAQVAWDYNRGGPVGWWKFDECQGTTAYDASGNSYNGTITPGNNTGDNDTVGNCGSSVTTEMWNDGTTGKYNSALDFDGTNDVVDIGDKDILNAISISAWIYWDATTTNDGIMSKRTGTEVSGDWALRMSDNGDGALEWMVWSGVDSSKNVYSTGTISTGAWHHVVLTFDNSNNTTKIYIDGKIDTTDTTTVTNDIANTSENLAIGYAGQSGSEYFDGRIDDVRVYNYALTDAQVKTAMNENAAIRFGPQTGSP